MDEIVVVPELSNEEVLRLYWEITDDLASRFELAKPKSERSREQHSLRSACLVEIRKRRLNSLR